MLRCGNTKATIWQNGNEKGPFFSTTFSRPFKDHSEVWRNSTWFRLNDHQALVNVAFETKEWFTAQNGTLTPITDPNYTITAPVPVGLQECWSMHFVHNTLREGSPYRILIVVDNWSRSIRS